MSSGRVISYEQVLCAAERLFHRTGRLDMDELAAASAVSRATLYRVAGNRDRVLGDVLWRQGSRSLHRVAADATGTGVDRLVGIAERFNASLLAYAPLRTFVRADPETAFRVLLMAGAGVHSRFVALWRDLLEQAEAAGELRLPLPLDDAAYVFVRIGESMLYSDLLGDREPDVALAAQAQRALLREDPALAGQPRGSGAGTPSR